MNKQKLKMNGLTRDIMEQRHEMSETLSGKIKLEEIRRKIYYFLLTHDEDRYHRYVGNSLGYGSDNATPKMSSQFIDGSPISKLTSLYEDLIQSTKSDPLDDRSIHDQKSPDLKLKCKHEGGHSNLVDVVYRPDNKEIRSTLSRLGITGDVMITISRDGCEIHNADGYLVTLAHNQTPYICGGISKRTMEEMESQIKKSKRELPINIRNLYDLYSNKRSNPNSQKVYEGPCDDLMVSEF